MNIKTPTISFCITCKNRIHQIRQTLPQNLKNNAMSRELIEFVLVDFGSFDGLREWITQTFQDELKQGYLKYFYTEELPYWHAPIAKNTAHLLASHTILVNLDCDNYTGNNGGQFVIREFLKQPEKIILHQFGLVHFDGTFGRISVDRKSFIEIGGYDESFEPMSMQDEDLIYRLRAHGLKYVVQPDSRYNQAIKNSKAEGLKYTNTTLTYDEMLDKNRKISEANLFQGKLVVNPHGWGIRKNIYDWNGNPVEINL